MDMPIKEFADRCDALEAQLIRTALGHVEALGESRDASMIVTSAIIAAACNLALRACSGDLERALGLLTNAPWRTVLRLELEDLRQDAKDAAAAP